MQTNQILASAVAFLGIFAGMAIAYFAKEELGSGKRYFLLMQKILIIIIFAIFLNYLQLNTYLKFTLYLAAILVVAFIEISHYIVYFLFVPVLVFSSRNMPVFSIQASLVFAYGLPTGSLLLYERVERLREGVKRKVKGRKKDRRGK